MTTPEQQIEILTQKLNVLENESRRILNALQWATKVRLILFTGLLIFALASVFMFFRLYEDIKTRRITEVQRLIAEQPAEFSEPLTRQLMALAEEQGPYVAEVFRDQAQKDSQLYMDAFDDQRQTMITNLQRSVEAKLARSYVTILDGQEKRLVSEFPALEDPAKLDVVRENLEKVYQKIGNRYYVNFLKEELDDLAEQLDTFPQSEPRQTNVPVGEQIATEFLELVRLMLIHSENYVIPEKANAAATTTPKKAKVVPAAVDVDSAEDDDSVEKESDTADDDKEAVESEDDDND